MKIIERISARTAIAAAGLEVRLSGMMLGWALLLTLACAARLAFAITPIRAPQDIVVAALPYALLILAPIATLVLALRWLPAGQSWAQPRIRLARIGRWQAVDDKTARSHRLFGTSGLMFSLLIGILLNIPVRTLEFLAAMPAAGASAPGWYDVLFTAMLADVVLLSALYAFAFVAALRQLPLFPRFLGFVWLADILMQLVIAHSVMAYGLPATVAPALHTILDGNLKKALISVALWAPYLLLSRRVNITYRRRAPIGL